MAALVGRKHKRNAEKIKMVISMAPREGRVLADDSEGGP